MTRQLVSFAIPAFNESQNIPILVEELKRLFQVEIAYDFEVVFCENGSSDESILMLRELNRQDARFKTVRLIRNFNMEGGMIAALRHVHGDACIIMSADLQDPPSLVPQMLRHWENGYCNVYTEVTYRHGESALRRFLASLFYYIIHRFSRGTVPKNASDFRLVSKAAYQEFNRLPERVRLVRSTWAWLGFPSIGIKYERPARQHGKSSFNPFVTAPYALRAILSTTFLPIRLLGFVGLVLCSASILSLGVASVSWLTQGVPFDGFGTLVALQLLLFGVLFGYLGILGEYISIIFEESRDRPTFIVSELIGLPTAEESGGR